MTYVPTLDTVKRQLHIDAADESDDERLTDLLALVPSLLAGYLKRPILSDDAPRTGERPWPRVTSTRVSVDDDAAACVAGSASARPASLPALDTLPDYGDWIEGTLRIAALDWVSEYYHRTDPQETTATEAGEMTVRGGAGIPARVRQVLAPVRALGA